jgi:hypothetical protein
MRSSTKRMVPVVLVGVLLMVWTDRADRDVAVAQQRTPIKVTRIFTGPDGLTHAEEMDPKLVQGANETELSETIKVTGLQFRRTSPKYFIDWHTAPQRQFVVTLRGRGEIEVAGGKKIALEPGHILLAEDVTGKGHISRAIGSDDRISLFIPLADQR